MFNTLSLTSTDYIHLWYIPLYMDSHFKSYFPLLSQNEQLKANQFQPLRGKISSQLIELQHLEYLDLSWNDLNRSQIPEFIGSLSNLRYLDFS